MFFISWRQSAGARSSRWVAVISQVNNRILLNYNIWHVSLTQVMQNTNTLIELNIYDLVLSLKVALDCKQGRANLRHIAELCPYSCALLLHWNSLRGIYQSNASWVKFKVCVWEFASLRGRVVWAWSMSQIRNAKMTRKNRFQTSRRPALGCIKLHASSGYVQMFVFVLPFSLMLWYILELVISTQVNK